VTSRNLRPSSTPDSIHLAPQTGTGETPQLNLVEEHTLGAATREWLVGPRQVPTFQKAHIKVAGYSKAAKGYAFVRHDPAFSQILVCVGGAGLVLVDGQWQRCPAGYAYLTPPHSLCAYRIAPRESWDVCWVLFEAGEALPGLEAGGAPRLVCADGMGLHLAIEGLCREAGTASSPSLVEHWATLVHRQALRLLQPAGGDPRLSRLWAAVRQDLGGAWTLSRMAHVAGMSPESLRRASRGETKRPPLAHLTRLRMEFAADLLSSSAEKISSIAERVGYADEFAFSTAFKRHWGLPPSRYRSGKS
jgi:AraC-like DNA-binding protein